MADAPARRRGARRARRLRVATVAALCVAGCVPGGLHWSLLSAGHASFEDAADEFPEFADVSRAFDRLVSPAPEEEERNSQLDLFAEVFEKAYHEYVEPVSAQAMVLLLLEGFQAAEDAAEPGDLASSGAGADDTDAATAAAAAPAEPVNPLAAENLMRAGLSGMLTGLDPHSGYLPPDIYQEMRLRTRGEFGGIGIEVTMEDGFVKIVAPIDDTPGQRAGLQTGDLITHVDGKAIQGLTLGEAVQLMRGRSGTDVRLDIRRPPAVETFAVIITRAVVRIRAVQARAEGRVGVLRITTFNERAEDGVRRAVRDLARDIDDPIAGYVLDLRNNPGGLLEQALGVADIFLPGGEIVSTRSRRSDAARRFSADRFDVSAGAPIVVLINGGSASAAEIVSGALQDHDRALIVGTPSFGKGSVQTIMPLDDGGAVRLTTARYYTPSGRSIQLTGIVPDILSEQDGDTTTRESDLDNALPAEVVTNGGDVRTLADACPDQAGEDDPVMACAIYLLEAREILVEATE